MSDDAVVTHVRDRVDRYLPVSDIEHVRQESRVMERLLSPHARS
ncbi:hypothetical protein [Halomonas aquatica]|uniref:Uncharacterized protein n=1 Tax=Halomonas aquatica TaxID=3151123 RepID=A0ABV1NEJ5_9GAMM